MNLSTLLFTSLVQVRLLVNMLMNTSFQRGYSDKTLWNCIVMWLRHKSSILYTVHLSNISDQLVLLENAAERQMVMVLRHSLTIE